jgi:hypothetical protein
MPNSKGKAKATVNQKTKNKVESQGESKGESQGKDSVLAVVIYFFHLILPPCH